MNYYSIHLGAISHFGTMDYYILDTDLHTLYKGRYLIQGKESFKGISYYLLSKYAYEHAITIPNNTPYRVYKHGGKRVYKHLYYYGY